MNQRNQSDQPTAVRDQRFSELCWIALDRGELTNGRHAMRVSDTTPEVWVWQREPNRLVAYSSMEADRTPSIEEFVLDFFI